MNRTQSTEFILDGLKRAMPNAHPEHLGGNDYRIWLTGLKTDIDVEIYLDKALAEYESSFNINVLIDFINTQLMGIKKAIEDGQDWLPRPVYGKLLPYVRTTDIAESKNETELLHDTLSGTFTVVYAEQAEQPTWLTKENLLPSFTHDSASDKAFENLKQLGWIREERVFQLGGGGKVLLFQHEGRPYQAQFLVKEWTDKYIGKKFHFTFPNENVTLVLVPNPLAIMNGMDAMQMVGMFGSVTMDFMNASPDRGLSPIIHTMENGDIKVLGGF